MYISTWKCESHNTVELILLPKKLVRFNVLCALSFIGHHNYISHTLRISHIVILMVDWGYLIKLQQDRPILVQMGCANLSLVIGSTATMNSDYLMPQTQSTPAALRLHVLSNAEEDNSTSPGICNSSVGLLPLPNCKE